MVTTYFKALSRNLWGVGTRKTVKILEMIASLPDETAAGRVPNRSQKCYYFNEVARVFYGCNIHSCRHDLVYIFFHLVL
jgi:hypothetical protein